MKRKIPKYLLSVLIPLFLPFIACSEDSLVSSNYPNSEIRIDSISVYVIRGVDPYSGNPAGIFVLDLYYELIGNPGAIYKVEFSPSPPGDRTFGIQYNSYIYHDPLPTNTPLEFHDDYLTEYDFADVDSIWTYFAVEVRFWRQVESHIQDETIRIPRGEDRKWQLLKVDVRDE